MIRPNHAVRLLCVLTALLSACGCANREPPTRPPIALISIDTLRADHVGCYGYPRDTTPTPDAFAADGVRFTTAISQYPHTLMLHMSMLNSLYPDVHGVITADHGEAFREHGRFLHEQLYDELVHVPLLIKLPRQRHGGRTVANQVQTIDIAPTTLDVAGVPIPPSWQKAKGKEWPPLSSARAAELWPAEVFA